MDIKISVIVPVYNVENYIEKCLESVINQTLKEVEIIIINDGSTDKSLDICKEYKKKDSRIIVIDQQNSGLGISRNNGIKKATGEFLCFLDSDDWLDLKTLKNCYSKAKKELADIVVFGFDRIDEDTQKVIQTRDDLIFDLDNIKKENFFNKVISANFKHMACSMISKRELFINNSLKFPSALHEDLYVTPQLFYYANKVSFINKSYYKWLIRKGSITNTVTSKHIDGIITAIFYVKCFLLKENIYDKYSDDFIYFYLTYIYLLYRRIKSFIKDDKEKQNLFNDLLLKSSSIINIKDIETSEIETKKYSEFLIMFKNYLISKEVSKSIVVDDNILSQLNEIKSSRGYKFLLQYYRYRDKYLPVGSKRRKIVKEALNYLHKRKNTKKYISAKSINELSSRKKYSVVFLPHKDYHMWTMGLIARELKKLKITACVLDLTKCYRDEGTRKEIKNFPDIDFLDFEVLQNEKINYDCLVCMNDWDKRVVRPQIERGKKLGKITIGIVEGVQDFLDLDTKQNRNTYQTVEYVFLTGKHDEQFFTNKLKNTYIIGIPRLKKLLNNKPIFPKKKLVVINMNFSYNVLSDKSKYWLDSAIEGCKKAGIDYIITQHPADKTDLTGYHVTNKTMYQIIEEGSIVISRFGSTIIEALAMGKPCIYHNPHGEKVMKYQEPMGAYSLSFDSNSLADAIDYELSLAVDYRKRAEKFLDYHCNVNSKESSAFLAAKYIKSIMNRYRE
ncbi:glycosyltransferase family 2 protein [Sulfurimonas sp.]|uniref:glycosyltransferase family 2 protein n=1 Tax=Sulfurimonas sp. TaxID=2022749 RepID=UPI002606436A|nr:glycosyltransferase family 2 protein [Sulfurimonas sp.]